MKNRSILVAVVLLFISTANHAQDIPAPPGPTQAWNFEVFLDKKPIGSHTFVKHGDGKNYEMHIDANFEVKFLFFVAYTYQHQNREQWRGSCLQAIESQTDDNGELYSVQGKRETDNFRVVANGEASELPDCITTFAYWDPGFLSQTSLMNSQTGEYMPVEITGPLPDTRVDRGTPVEAQRYRIQARDVDIQLWYSQSGDWLALESAVEGGRTLRYLRSDQVP